MSDPFLERYRRSLEKRLRKDCPNFDPKATRMAKILAILDTPSNSGAEKTRTCSIDNPDPTARRSKKMLHTVGLPPDEVLFWNFYAAYKKEKSDWPILVDELRKLIELMTELRTIIVFGDVAWRAIRDVELRPNLFLVGAPHPSNRSCNRNRNAEENILRAWERAFASIS